MGTTGRSFRAIKPRNNPGEGSSGQLPGEEQWSRTSSSRWSSEKGFNCLSRVSKKTNKGRDPEEPTPLPVCSGQPCSECQTHIRECVFDKLSDRRRKATAKKTQEELTSLQEFVRELLGALRSSDGTLAQHTLDTIRAGASEDDILAAIRHVQAHAALSADLRWRREWRLANI
ncbi:C6 transcription factor SndA [Penicillium chermesinum]|uniref:C6 transcription factor SndA n=1 Tax=Penicillium chermesinum TaxID=63820 RepID=A0A9W9P5G0_9EURO|nr:C6 transcription factor SndA [Penicillium chermesinum]KAJ5238278.1 C6 transcription factor SndA [Penicillium chermesinum]